MEQRGQFTREEIYSQPAAWSAALEALEPHRNDLLRFFQKGEYAQTIFSGCGSTYYLSLAAAALFQEMGAGVARAFPASELWFYPNASYPGKGRVLMVAVSRSGETTETLRMCEAFKASSRGDLLTLTCYADCALAKMGDINLVFPSGAEQSVAQTRAFSTLYLATVALAALWTGKDALYRSLEKLPAAGSRLLGQYGSLAGDTGRDMNLDRFYFLGSGPRYGLACELNLKMKEMTLSFSEAFHFMEFRHGPKSMITPSTLVVGLVSQVNTQPERAVLNDIRLLGGRVLTLAEENADVVFTSNVDEAIRNVLYLPVGQVLAFERAMAKGLNPDRPTHLDTVVKL